MKTFKSFTADRHEDNRPALVRVVTEAEMTYRFEIIPETSDRRILALVGSLVDFEEHGEQVKRKRRK